MEPSTTNSIEIHHKTLTPTTIDHDHDPGQVDDHDHDPELLNISCKPHHDINSSSRRAFLVENTGNETLARENVASQCKQVTSEVVVPEKWGQENLLKDWIDYSTFDALLAPKEAGSAREALIEEARRGHRVSNI